MAQLTALDAAFRKAPDSDTCASMALGAVAIVKGSVPDYELVETLLAERIRTLPRCKQVLRDQWIDDPDFDLARQIRRVALPAPGDETELFQLIAHTLERPLDMDLPLWECWIIEGLQDNRWAILMKIHHCMTDQISAAQILTRLCDDADMDAFANHSDGPPSPTPHETRSWTDALWQAPAAVSAHLVKAAVRAFTLPTTWTTPAGPLHTRRRYRTVRVPRASVDDVARKFGVTANDVALAVITEGFRSVLLRRGEQPRADSLRTLAKADDRISALLPYLPVEHDDPIQQLRAVHGRLNRTAPNNQPTPVTFLDYPPFALCTKAIQALIRLPQRGVVTLATNTPGPRRRLQLMGQRLEQVLPIPPIALQLSTGVAVLSYGDELVFGITADYAAAPDMAQLAAGIELGMARLVALSQNSVLLFTKDRRKRAARTFPGGTQRPRPSTPTARARR